MTIGNDHDPIRKHPWVKSIGSPPQSKVLKENIKQLCVGLMVIQIILSFMFHCKSFEHNWQLSLVNFSNLLKHLEINYYVHLLVSRIQHKTLLDLCQNFISSFKIIIKRQIQKGNTLILEPEFIEVIKHQIL